jgi:hypothetical protein
LAINARCNIRGRPRVIRDIAKAGSADSIAQPVIPGIPAQTFQVQLCRQTGCLENPLAKVDGNISHVSNSGRKGTYPVDNKPRASDVRR